MEPKAVAVELEKLHSITALVEEGEEVSAEWVFFELAPDDAREAVVGLAEVYWLAMDEHSNRGRDAQHASASIRARRVVGSKPGLTAMRTPS